MAKQNLSPKLKAAADAIYNTNPVRYQELIRWIRKMQGFNSDKDITKALKIAYINIAWVDDVWPWLTEVLLDVTDKAHPAIRSKNLDSINEVLGRIMKKATEQRH